MKKNTALLFAIAMLVICYSSIPSMSATKKETVPYVVGIAKDDSKQNDILNGLEKNSPVLGDVKSIGSLFHTFVIPQV